MSEYQENLNMLAKVLVEYDFCVFKHYVNQCQKSFQTSELESIRPDLQSSHQSNKTQREMESEYMN